MCNVYTPALIAFMLLDASLTNEPKPPPLGQSDMHEGNGIFVTEDDVANAVIEEGNQRSEGFLTSWWRDLFSIVGVIGALASGLALLYAIWQIRKTKSAAEAAKFAAQESRNDIELAFRTYNIANSLSYIAELKEFIDNEHWHKATIRLDDLAAVATQIEGAQGFRENAELNAWKNLSQELRGWSSHCRRVALGEIRFQKSKWRKFRSQLESTFHEYHGPFNTNE